MAPNPSRKPENEDDVNEQGEELVDPGMGKEQQSQEEYDDPAETLRNDPDRQRKGEHVETP